MLKKPLFILHKFFSSFPSLHEKECCLPIFYFLISLAASFSFPHRSGRNVLRYCLVASWKQSHPVGIENVIKSTVILLISNIQINSKDCGGSKIIVTALERCNVLGTHFLHY